MMDKLKEFPNLSLKNLKFFEAGSEETPCFTADLYDNGKLVAHVSNDGHGGSNRVYPVGGIYNKDVEQYMEIDQDCWIMELAERGNIVKKYQTKAIVIEKNGEIQTVTFKGNPSISKIKKGGGLHVLIKTRDKYIAQGYNVLNTNF